MSVPTWQRLADRLGALLRDLPGEARVVCGVHEGNEPDTWFLTVRAYPAEDTEAAAAALEESLEARCAAIFGPSPLLSGGVDYDGPLDARAWHWVADLAPELSWRQVAARLRQAERGP